MAGFVDRSDRLRADSGSRLRRVRNDGKNLAAIPVRQKPQASSFRGHSRLMRTEPGICFFEDQEQIPDRGCAASGMTAKTWPPFRLSDNPQASSFRGHSRLMRTRSEERRVGK